jgi:hypothetical protein
VNSADTAEPSVEAFFLPTRTRPLQLIALTLTLCAIAFVLYVGTVLSTPSFNLYTLYTLGLTIFFVRFAVIIIRHLKTVDDRTAVDGSGIWYLPAGSAPVLLRWNDIGTIKRKGFLIRNLEIVDRTDVVIFKMADRFKHFDILNRMINEHTKV